jgi:hypothetical protein
MSSDISEMWARGGHRRGMAPPRYPRYPRFYSQTETRELPHVPNSDGTEWIIYEPTGRQFVYWRLPLWLGYVVRRCKGVRALVT